MNAHKNKQTDSPKPQTAVNGSHGRRTKLISLVIIIILILAGAAVTLYVANQPNHEKTATNPTNNDTHKKTKQLTVETVDKNQSTINQALGLALNGNTAGAQKLLDQHIAKTTDKTKQGRLYEVKSNLAYTAKDYKNGLQYAQKAESLHATTNSATWIAKNAEALGNKSIALKYYKLELSRWGKPITPSDKDNQAAVQAKIKALEG